MARLFDGNDDRIVCALGSANADLGEAWTIAILAKVASVGSGVVGGLINTTGGNDWSIWHDGPDLGLFDNNFERWVTDAISAGAWHLIIVSKPAGTSIPRAHIYNYGTETWLHWNFDASIPDGTASAGRQWVIGREDYGGNTLDGSIGAIAMFGSALASDQAAEGLSHWDYWKAAEPAIAWDLRTVPLVDEGSGGTANQVSITGTTADTPLEAFFEEVGPPDPPPDPKTPTALLSRLAESTGSVVAVSPSDDLSEAINAALPGEILELSPGEYVAPNQTAAITVEGTAESPITVRAKTPGTVITKGRWQFSGAGYLRVQDIDHEGTPEANSTGVWFTGDAHDIEWLRGSCSKAQQTGFISDEGSVNIHWVGARSFGNGLRNEATQNLDHGWYVSGTGCMLLNCLAYGNPARGVQLYPGAFESVVASSTFAYNGRSGIQVGGSEWAASSDNMIVNNISAFNEYGIRTSWDGDAGIYNVALNNLVYGNSINDVWVTVPGSLEVTPIGIGDVDPLFVSESDFRLTDESPALGAADQEWAPDDDLWGEARPEFAAVGAFETKKLPVPAEGAGGMMLMGVG